MKRSIRTVRMATVAALLALSAVTVTAIVPGTAASAATATVFVDGTGSSGPATGRLQGFLHGLKESPDPAAAQRVAALNPKVWRVGNDATYDLAKAAGAEIMWVISDSWRNSDPSNGGLGFGTNGSHGLGSPWMAFPVYDQFVKDLVQHTIDSNRPVDYWDVYNEPNNGGFHTTATMLEIFKHAHDSIRAVTPDAKIIGPSLAVFEDRPRTVESDPVGAAHNLDLATFLDYVEANGLRYDGIVWHEIIDLQGRSITPPEVTSHVSRARALIAAHPNLAEPNPMLMINEYSNADNQMRPGWTVGWLATMEAADVDVANRACFDSNDGGTTYSQCDHGVDGLVLTDQVTPRPLYWVHHAYGQMSGTRLPAGSTDTDIATFATRTAGGGIQVLLGRYGDVGTSGASLRVTLPSTAMTNATASKPKSPRHRAAAATCVSAVVKHIPTGAEVLPAPIPDAPVTLAMSGQEVLLPITLGPSEAQTVDLTPSVPCP